jgi:putative ABC transport system ATP-binding protein
MALVATDSKSPAVKGETGKAIFHVHDITKVYHMGDVDVHALRGVDFDLNEGEFIVVLGPSGSGKSTLLNILGGLDTPSSGEVLYRDHKLTSANDAGLTRFRREHVGFVFQFYNLIPSLTALENVALFLARNRARAFMDWASGRFRCRLGVLGRIAMRNGLSEVFDENVWTT